MTTYKQPIRSFAVLDIETLNLMEGYAAYRQMDPRHAELRWPFKKACAASVLTFSVDEHGMFEFGKLHSFASADEKILLRELFTLFHELPEHVCVTWGGLAHDLLILRMGAARHQLRLPRQLVHGARAHGEWLHRDFGKETKAGGGAWMHLSEVASTLKLPVKFGGSASMVPMLVANEKWERLKNIASADVISTTLAFASHLCAHGELISASAAHYVVLDEVTKIQPPTRYHDYLVRLRNRMKKEMMDAAQEFIDAA
jgi:glutamate-1-semialdehyde aminotransferase